MKNLKKNVALAVGGTLLLLLNGCKNNDAEPTALPIREHSIVAESIIAPGGSQSTTNKCFLNLYDGLAYTKSEAEANSSKVDFAYNYRGGGCNTCRFFENVKNMSTRTGYVSSFSTITDSRIANVEQYDGITPDRFEQIKNAKDIDDLFAEKKIQDNAHGHGDITNRTTDVAVGRVFAFIDKSGKKGFFRISDYVANVPTGDKATLTLSVKVQE
ncbi:hypothetical protein GCM10027275_48680 [Rhabdobacter roseus]|uniref:Nitrogen regulatory protein PII-like uncharacterized protein n=1 Tax=Rhabdobacter roseus TaxID=1655419 RepID=A0A840TZ87_9BACT|nr:hypothetical protein [Rhabdobacter roseus]MBB5286932.1 nitrogen regulatory protein PII-like uncharacterized protein [Rhabdobacter roseus]